MPVVFQDEESARILLNIMVFSKFQLRPGRIAPKEQLNNVWHTARLADPNFSRALMFAMDRGWVETRGGYVKLTQNGYHEA